MGNWDSCPKLLKNRGQKMAAKFKWAPFISGFAVQIHLMHSKRWTETPRVKGIDGPWGNKVILELLCLLKLFLGLFQGCQLMCNCQLYSCLLFLILLWVVHRYNSKFRLHYWRLKHVWKSLQIGWGDMCSLMLVIECGFQPRIYLWKVLVGNFLHCGLDHLRLVR